MSFSLVAVLRLRKELDDVAYVIAHRWRLLFIPTKKVAIDVELLRKSNWARKRLANREILVWTVNEVSYAKMLREWKVVGVITDRPDLPFRLS
jgi:glycerophosphoryl diester phosphodiesterase